MGAAEFGVRQAAGHSDGDVHAGGSHGHAGQIARPPGQSLTFLPQKYSKLDRYISCIICLETQIV